MRRLLAGLIALLFAGTAQAEFSGPNTVGTVSTKQLGAIADGQTHPLSGYFPTLAAAQALCPDAVALTDEMDWCAFDAAVQGAKAKGLKGDKILFPTGTYLFNRPIPADGASLFLKGDGELQSVLIWTTQDGDGIYFGLGGTHQGVLRIEDMTIAPKTASATAIAINAEFNRAKPTFDINRVSFGGALLGVSTGGWGQATKCLGCSEAQWDHIRIDGPGVTGGITGKACMEFNEDASHNGHYGFRFANVYAQGCAYGWLFNINTTNGFQGIIIRDSYVVQGYDAVRLVSPNSFGAVQVVLDHFEAQVDGALIHCEKCIDLSVTGSTAYMRNGSTPGGSLPTWTGFAHLVGDSRSIVAHNQMSVTGSNGLGPIFVESNGVNGIAKDNIVSGFTSGFQADSGSTGWKEWDNTYLSVGTPVADAGTANNTSLAPRLYAQGAGAVTLGDATNGAGIKVGGSVITTFATGSTYQIPDGISVVLINNGAGIATATINFPVNPIDGQTVMLTTAFNITTLTLADPNSHGIVGGATTLTTTAPVAYKYFASGGAKWTRVTAF